MTPIEAAAAYAASSDRSTRAAGVLALERLVYGDGEEEGT